MEQPTEEINKHLHEQAHQSHDKGIMKIALSSALIAVLAAVASMISEHQSNEAMLSQLKASDQWAYYQAKGIKHNVLDTQIVLLEAQGFKDQAKLGEMKAAREKYRQDQDEIAKEATKEQDDSLKALKSHNSLSYAETFLQVAIGVSAISALTRRRWLWVTSLFVAAAGLGFLIWGVLRVLALLG
jgi:hypothetical protein